MEPVPCLLLLQVSGTCLSGRVMREGDVLCGGGGGWGWEVGVGWYPEVPIVLEHPAGAWSQPEAMDCSHSEAWGGGGGAVCTVVAI